MVVYLTHGAKKNVGDYLIHSRARELWHHFAPETEVVSVPRWSQEPLPESSTALVLCGGPAFSTRMVEDVFPVMQPAREAGKPVAGLAIGWHGMPAIDPKAFTISGRTIEMLQYVNRWGPISVRDDVTQRVAQAFGVDTVRTGCSVWYSVPHLGQSARVASKNPQTVIFTTPARYQNTRETISIMRLLRKRFQNSRLIAAFHRGIKRDSLTSAKSSRYLQLQAIAARTLGYEVRDVSYDLGKIGFYEEADLHIGYRVHAHLDFVSRRVPSILVSEDGRGGGQTESLHGKDQILWAGAPGLIEQLGTRIENELCQGWPSLQRAIETIESTLPVMQERIREQAKLAS